MSTKRSPRKGSLQFWPRKRASKFLPRVNWKVVSDSTKNVKGFIGYKAGMASAFVKDNTEFSMTKGKRIIVPVTVVECPTMRIFSVRFYKNGKVMKDILVENLDKELKRKIKFSKTKKGNIDDVKDYDDVRVIFYSQVKKTGIKKTPDLSEIDLKGNVDEKLSWIKENLNKEISVLDVFESGQLVDVRGLTKGKGLQGPVKRFGITLKSHKSEKGVRRPGSLGPWHPARVTFRAPQAGQLGMFTRTTYNSKIVDMGKAEGKFNGIKNYGDVKTDYLLLRGNVQGPAKRQIILTTPMRATKKQTRKNFELLEMR
jgi:large subunit ribosomal protein L3